MFWQQCDCCGYFTFFTQISPYHWSTLAAQCVCALISYASIHTRTTSRDLTATDVLGSRGDVSVRSPTSRGDVSETSSEFLSRLQ